MSKIPAALRRAFTLLAVLLGWVFFRAQSLEQAAGILAAMFGLTDGTYVAGDVLTHAAGLALLVGGAISFPVWPWLQRRFHAGPFGVLCLAALLVLAAAAIAGNTYSAFIYFRF